MCVGVRPQRLASPWWRTLALCRHFHGAESFPLCISGWLDFLWLAGDAKKEDRVRGLFRHRTRLLC